MAEQPNAFTWRDGERIIRFGRGSLDTAGELLGSGYALLTTPRARAAATAVVAAAATVHDVGPGLVEALAAEALDAVPADARLVVALGGGRVIDTAKAVAAVRGIRAAAIPTTLSAAEMTARHRLPADAPASARPTRPSIVINDPLLSASQPPDAMAASAANALAHAAEGAVTTRTSPLPRLAAAEAARLIAAAYGLARDGGTGPAGAPPAAEPDRDALALGALLSGYAIDSASFGLHHVLAQTLARAGGIGHGPANAALLPHTLGALERRAGGRALPGLAPVARALARRAGASRLRDLGVDRDALPHLADAAAARAELDHTPPRAGRDELLELYEAAW
jgi:alcohol dehydrogenase class IV